MNERQAEALKRLIEDRHPDAGVTVTAEPDGARVVISGPGVLPGPSGHGEVELSLRDGSPYLWLFLAGQEQPRKDA